MWDIQLFKLNFDHREPEAARRVVEGGWLTMGEHINDFEESFSGYLGGDVQSVAVSSGTAALHMAMLALSIGPGDEVIIPALTFVADANAVKLCGATPVLADSHSIDDWNISAETIERVISPRTRAVVVVHFAGYPCDMPAIAKLCQERGLKLIEDAAHAPGAGVGGRACGTWGDVGCFSFFSNKNLSIGEGGMAVTRDPDLAQRLRHLRSHGMTSMTLDRHKGRSTSYDVVIPGLNYRMDEIRAAIGLVQLEKLDQGNERRKVLTELYRESLTEIGISVPFGTMPEANSSAYHIMPVLLPPGSDRGKVMQVLKDNKIQSSIHYPPFWSFAAYEDQYSPSTAANAAQICERELTLPLYPTMTEDEVGKVVDVLAEAIK